MKLCDSRIRNASLVMGLMACSMCGCSFFHTSIADNPTKMQNRVSVDDFVEEDSGFEAVGHQSSRTASAATQSRGNGRQKLANWQNQRDGNDPSIPVERTDQQLTAQADAEESSALSSTSPLSSKSPFDQALTSKRRTAPRANAAESNDPESTSSSLSPESKNPFED